jgi:hypothetical protein
MFDKKFLKYNEAQALLQNNNVWRKHLHRDNITREVCRRIEKCYFVVSMN